MPDGPDYDYFATQFATSIVNESGGNRSNYWFGRMLRFIGSTEYVMKNFFGKNYTESQFREKYQNGEITIDVFDISNVSYAVDPNDATLATATMDVHIEGTVDGAKKKGNFTIAHKIKQGWQAYESELTAA